MKEENPVDRNGRFLIGTVFVRYTLAATGEIRYTEAPVSLQYTGSFGTSDRSANRYVLADALIQNTPLVLKETAEMVNKSKNHLTAMELVQTQKLLLETIREVRQDKAVDEDIEMLQSTYQLLLDQARTLNLIMTP
jgi:hypothetical protein